MTTEAAEARFEREQATPNSLLFIICCGAWARHVGCLSLLLFALMCWAYLER